MVNKGIYGFCNLCGNPYEKYEEEGYIARCLTCDRKITQQDLKNFTIAAINRELTEEEKNAKFIQELKKEDSIEDKQKIIRLLQRKYLFYTDFNDPNLLIYVWDKNIWKSHSEAVVLNELEILFGDQKVKIKKDELFDYLKGYGQKTDVEPKPPNLIPFTNGLFNIDTNKLEESTPKYFIKNLIPWEYEPKAKCKKWLKFLKQIHEPEDIDFIQEWFGYHFYTSYPVKSFLICIGSGHNGKTVELTILTNVLGEENVTEVSLQEINHVEYAPSELENKLGNISDDIPSRKISFTSKLKILSDGGRVSARRIYGNPYSFRNYAKITNSCNEPPEIADDTDAMWDRLKAINYPVQFVDKPDPTKNQKPKLDRDELVNDLMSEIPGIINWMIKGLKRLKKNKFRFSFNYSTTEIRNYYRRKSKPVVAWMEDELVWTGDEDNDYVRKDEIYEFFTEWCGEKNVKPITTRSKFFRELKWEGLEAIQKKDLEMIRIYLGYRHESNRITGKHMSLSEKSNSVEEGGEKSCYPVTKDKIDGYVFEDDEDK